MNTIEKRNHALLYGAVAFLFAVFTVLSVIIFWPQDAPENIRELTIESGVSSKEFQLCQSVVLSLF